MTSYTPSANCAPRSSTAGRASDMGIVSPLNQINSSLMGHVSCGSISYNRTADMISTETNPPAPAWDETLLQNPHAVADKRARAQRMFAAISTSYDLNNRLHSLWMDQAWRRKAVKLAELKATDRVADVACGTGDLSIKFRSRLLSIGARGA